MREFLPYGAFLVASVSCIVSVWTLIRAARWRNAEALGALVGRVSDLERVKGLVAQRLDVLEEDVKGLPTRADFARLEGEVKSTCRIAERTEASVTRIEGFLMERRP